MNKYSQMISRTFFATMAVIFMSACDLSDGPIEEAGEKLDEAVDKSMQIGDLQPTVEKSVQELDKALEQSAAQLEKAADSAEKAGSRLESTIEVPPE